MLLRFLCFGALATGALTAQFDRYELGLRLRACERLLADTAAEPARDAALREFDRAVQAFFRFNGEGVARAIAAAESALAPSASPARPFATSLQVRLARRLADPSHPLAFEVLPTWVADAPPQPLRLTMRVGPDPKLRADVNLDALPVNGTLDLTDVPAGDHELFWTVQAGETTVLSRRQGLSLATRLDERLAAVSNAAGRRDRSPTTIEAGTLDLLAGLLTGMTRPRGEETILPGHRLLEDAEALARPVTADTAPFYGPGRPGQHWLRLPVGTGTVVARVLVPPPPTTKAAEIPLVLALHGMGGSENLFFDGYGDGAIVAACTARGWFLAAPRLGATGIDLPGLVDALAARWPIDRRRVLVVGHSMGAAQAMAGVARDPARFAAVAALGGGGTAPRGEDAAKLRYFVGIGQRDFARSGALRLHQALAAAGLPVTLREYPLVEHLTVVQFALPDVFACFDAAVAAR